MALTPDQRSALEASIAERTHASTSTLLPSYVCTPPLTRAPIMKTNLAPTTSCSDRLGCLCERAGDECTLGLSSTAEYLPDADYVASLQAAAVAPPAASLDMLGSLLELQFPRTCARAAAAGYWNAGFGATFHYVLVNLKRAYRDSSPAAFLWAGSPTARYANRSAPLLLDSGGRWNYGHCTSGGLDCVFLPHTSCEAHLRANDVDRRRLKYPVRLPDHEAGWVPARFEEAGHGVFWLISTLAGFMWRLQPTVVRAVRKAAGRIAGLPERYLGLHLRRGDACANGADKRAALRKMDRWCAPVSEYAAQVERVARRYQLESVFVASDEEAALAELRNLLPSHLTLFTQPTVFSGHATHTRDGGSIEETMFRASEDSKQVATAEVVTDVVLLAQSRVLVGAFSSTISRLALELHYFHTSRMPPFVSLDFSWCWGGYSRVPVTVRGGNTSRYPC